MNAGLLGYVTGVLVMVVVIPALIGGLFRRKSPPSPTWISIAWVIALILAAGGIVGGTSWIIEAGCLAGLAALTAMRFTAWRRHTAGPTPSI